MPLGLVENGCSMWPRVPAPALGAQLGMQVCVCAGCPVQSVCVCVRACARAHAFCSACFTMPACGQTPSPQPGKCWVSAPAVAESPGLPPLVLLAPRPHTSAQAVPSPHVTLTRWPLFSQNPYFSCGAEASRVPLWSVEGPVPPHLRQPLPCVCWRHWPWQGRVMTGPATLKGCCLFVKVG